MFWGDCIYCFFEKYNVQLIIDLIKNIGIYEYWVLFLL